MKIESSEITNSGKWTNFITAKWKNGKNYGTWEYISRKNKQKGIVIIPRFISGSQEKYILIKQKRVPFNNYVIEFPAGLVESNETVENCAHRELKEETGASGEIRSISPLLSTSSGITDELIYFVYYDVMEIGKKNLDESEDIETIIKSKRDIKNYLKSNNEHIIDSKVWAYFT